MGLITPAIGLVFWTSVVFVILLVLLRKLAWKPILGAVKEREENISNALASAEKAKEELTKLQSSNEQLLKEAYAERDNLLKAAQDAHDKIVAEAKGHAQEEADKMIAKAQAEISAQKNAALSVEIAEKLLKSELSEANKQSAVANQLIEEVSFN